MLESAGDFNQMAAVDSVGQAGSGMMQLGAVNPGFLSSSLFGNKTVRSYS